MPDPKVSTIRMPDNMKSDLAAIARSRDMSVAEAIREALEQYITARKSEERFKERLARRLEEDREVLDRLGKD
ncbi:MAG: ribbon-helix-helix protein, CopG family [Solirubrobacterales bacterium]